MNISSYLKWLTIFFLLSPIEVSAQNVIKADSLLNTLDSKSLSQEETLEILWRISMIHPDAVIALEYAYKGLALALEIENPILEAKCYEEIGLNERVLGNNLKSVNASLKALKIAEQLNAEDMIASILVQLGVNAANDEDYQQAVNYFQKSIKTHKKNGKLLHVALTNINLGEAYRLNGRLDSAVYWFEEALSLNDSLHHPIVASYALGNLGMTYNNQGRLSEARQALTESLEMVKELGDPYTHAVYLADLALINQKEKAWDKAESDFIEALKIAQENKLKEQIRDISALLVSFYKVREDYKHALFYQELFQVYQDSLVNKVNVQQLERLKANHKIGQKEMEIGHLNERNAQQKQKTIGVIAIMALFIGLSFLLYQSNQQKVKANLALSIQKELIETREQEKALLLKELNHRVKNNLQMISSLLNLQGNELKGHPAEAAIAAGKYRVDALALIHQKLYREEVHTKIALKDYVEELALNLCYSFGNKVTPDLKIEDVTVGIDQAIPLSLIINELITNALKYAFDEIQHPKLTVHIDTSDQHLVLQVQDNGIGFTQKKTKKDHSFGIKLVNSLATQLKADITHTNDQGSLWIISLPYESSLPLQT